MKYQIIWDISVSDLSYKVNKEISNGWIPIGGLTYQYDGGRFYQAMVKESE